MSDSITAVFSIGWLAGAISALAIIGVTAHERRNKRQLGSDYISIDSIPDRNRDRSRSNGSDKQLDAEKEILEHAKKLGVRIGG